MHSLNSIKQNLILNRNPFTPLYGLGRSIISIGTLSVFIFNDFKILFNQEALQVLTKSEFILNHYNFFALFGYDNLWAAKILSILILLLVISGYFSRISGVLHFWICYSFYHSGIILDGGDQICVIFSFLLIPLTVFDKRKIIGCPKKINLKQAG